MLAQLLKNLYICTFYTCGQTKSRKWSLRLQGGEKREKGTPDPQVLTITNQSPLSKVKTVKQVPPGGRSFDKNAEKKHKSAHSPLYIHEKHLKNTSH